MSTSVKDRENTLAISTGANNVENYFYINVTEIIDGAPAVDITENARVFLDENLLKEESLLLKKIDSFFMIFQLQKSSKNFIYNENEEFIRYNLVGNNYVPEVITENQVAINEPTLDSFNAADALALPFLVYRRGSSKPQVYTISHEANTKNITILITTITP